ncbi:MAG TPA: DNA repair protein RecO [Solirubrobacteraceae bacterium]|jgi:DNA repair protein RecO (recombination protein O)|nr:DNA repair protein RecO [Solirubrobacteraceae bacterium]
MRSQLLIVYCLRERIAPWDRRTNASDLDLSAGHDLRLDRPMSGLVKTEAVVLRSMRYGEADRILHVYTPQRGRVSAIAKGVRRARSRFGGRLEPFFRLRIEMHEGRGELLTVTGAQTVDGHPSLRGDARALDAAARACDAVGRLFETAEPHPGVFNLLCRELSLLDANPAEATRASALAFRLKLLVAAGIAPQLSACACCGESEHLVGFSGAAGGVVCRSCWSSESSLETRAVAAFPLSQPAHTFMTEALGSPLSDAPSGEQRALGEVERAVSEMLGHHAHVRLMPATDRRVRRLAVDASQPHIPAETGPASLQQSVA